MKLLAALLTSVATWSVAQLANQPPQPMWISPKAAEQPVETTFAQTGKLLRAILLVASEADVEATLNDKPLGRRIPAGETATSIDVTALVVPGDNRLRLTTGGKRLAALLELNGDLATKTWIKTDGSWTNAANATAIDATQSPFDFKKTFDAYNSWQLAKPGAQSQATPAESLTLLPGFKAELIRSAQPGEDSWVSMAFDAKGRITLGKEKKGLLRFDPKTTFMEVIDDTLLECRGLLYAHGALYANANNSHGLFRLRDTNDDDRFDESIELLHTDGGVGHGRNHLKLGPDGDIYIAHGNNVLLPTNISDKSPLKNYRNDQLLPNPWDDQMFDGNVQLPAGHILRMKPDGSEVQLLAGGLRNPLDIAFNHEGDLFTFDADMERDVGAPWYMPTRVLHVVPGADFGWRRGTGRYPAYYIDTLPSVIDIGLASPTAVFFGYGAKFPAKYQNALFIFDWSYGRIIAVHLKPRGSSYGGEQETFVSGRPLNVTDGCIGPDGAMWFVTGGRGTQSGLYRVTSNSPEPESTQVRRTRTTEENPTLDRFVRHGMMSALNAAALTIEQINSRSQGWDALSVWWPAVQRGPANVRDAVLLKLSQFGWDHANEEKRLALLRIAQVGLMRGGQFDGATESWLDQLWSGAKSTQVRWELTKLLIYLKSPTIIAKACDYLKTATTSEDLLFYPMHLRYLKDGWTLEQRRIVFDALNRAEKLNGASSYFKAIADTRAELVAALTADEAKALADVITASKPELLPAALPGHSFKQWTLKDLEPSLPKVAKGRSYEGARKALVAAQCVFCHRVSAGNELPAGVVGPDLTQVAARFGRADLLKHILEPSLVIDEKFRATLITKTDGTQVSGMFEREDDERVVLKPNALASDVIEVGKAQIKERKLSEVSPMPPGLLNVLKQDQILDVLAWFESGGDASKPVWQP